MEELYSWLFIHDLEDEYARIKMNFRKIDRQNKKTAGFAAGGFLFDSSAGRCRFD
jgi:hypothetical protein